MSVCFATTKRQNHLWSQNSLLILWTSTRRTSYFNMVETLWATALRSISSLHQCTWRFPNPSSNILQTGDLGLGSQSVHKNIQMLQTIKHPTPVKVTYKKSLSLSAPAAWMDGRQNKQTTEVPLRRRWRRRPWFPQRFFQPGLKTCLCSCLALFTSSPDSSSPPCSRLSASLAPVCSTEC